MQGLYIVALCDSKPFFGQTGEEAWDVVSHEKALQTARRALQRGFAPDVIAELTRLPIEDVRNLL